MSTEKESMLRQSLITKTQEEYIDKKLKEILENEKQCNPNYSELSTEEKQMTRRWIRYTIEITRDVSLNSGWTEFSIS